MSKRNVRTLLPGEWIVTQDGDRRQVHHLQVLPGGPDGATVLICLAKSFKNCPEFVAAQGGDFRAPGLGPVAERGPNDEVEVVDL